MVRFAHLADVHLGGWRQPPMRELNFESFKKAINICINEKFDFVLIAGDLFDSAYPPIETLKSTFAEFKKLKEANIPCFIIPGSHDYSVSGKSFLDVLEHAGFCTNIAVFDEKEDKIILNPTIIKNVALYGYPGKKAGLEIQDIKKITLNDSPGMFKILALHTTLDKAKGDIPTDSVESDSLPKADYYALGHLHVEFNYKNFIYAGPIFPNNFQELEDLQSGGFYSVDTSPLDYKKINIKIKDVLPIQFTIRDTIDSTSAILNELKKHDLKDKIILLRFIGELEYKKNSGIKFSEIEKFAMENDAYFVLKNTHELKTKEPELDIETQNSENIEEETIKIYCKENPSVHNKIILQLMSALSIDKQEGETNENFTNRLIEESRKILKF